MYADDSYSDDCIDAGSDDIQLFSTLVDEQFTIENIGEVSTQVKSNVRPLALLDQGCAIASILDESKLWPNYDVQPGPGWLLGPKSVGGGPPRRHFTTRGEHGPFFEPPSYDGQDRFTAHASLLRYAIYADNLDLARYLLELGAEFSMRSKHETESSQLYSVSYTDFVYAMKLGRTQILAEIIKRTGAGIPLDDLVQESGVEVAQKPKYYRGLSVHGKKRADWAAAAGHGQYVAQSNWNHPPALEAAFRGNIESVEWFLSDAPMRHYSAFASANQSDERLQGLVKASGGIEQSISRWLDTRSKKSLTAPSLH